MELSFGNKKRNNFIASFVYLVYYFHKVSNNNQNNSRDYIFENKIWLNSNENDNSISEYFIKHNKDIFKNIYS
jgi:hypothetical protein